MWVVYAYMNANLRRARFTQLLWSDALRAAVWQINCVPGVRSRRAAGKSRYERYHLVEPDYSLMVGRFGQTAYLHVEGRKVNGCLAMSVPGFFVCPSLMSSGWLCRSSLLMFSRCVTTSDSSTTGTRFRPG